VLYEDSTIQWFEKASDKKAEGAIRIKDVASFFISRAIHSVHSKPTHIAA